jgi:YjzC-like protein
MSEEKFNTGQTVPQSGIYRVTHAGHRLPHEVTLIAGEIFPRCSKCKDAVQFEAVRHATLAQADRSFKIVVYELPVVEEEDNPTETMAS